MPMLADEIGELPAHVLAQTRIEIRQRLVEQQQFRTTDQGTRQRDALLLPA